MRWSFSRGLAIVHQRWSTAQTVFFPAPAREPVWLINPSRGVGTSPRHAASVWNSGLNAYWYRQMAGKGCYGTELSELSRGEINISCRQIDMKYFRILVLITCARVALTALRQMEKSHSRVRAFEVFLKTRLLSLGHLSQPRLSFSVARRYSFDFK